MTFYDARYRQSAYLAAMETANATHYAPNSHEWWQILKKAETAEMERLCKEDQAEAQPKYSRLEDLGEYRPEDHGDWAAWKEWTGDFVGRAWSVAHFQPDDSTHTACGREIPTDFRFEHAHELDANSRRCKRCERALRG